MEIGQAQPDQAQSSLLAGQLGPWVQQWAQ